MKIKRKLPPGTLIYTGDIQLDTTISHFQYNVQEFIKVDDLYSSSTDHVDLLVVEGLVNVNLIQEFSKKYKIDKLVIEDILNPDQRNKYEVHGNYVYISMKYITNNGIEVKFHTISMILYDEALLLFTEDKNPFVAELRKRYENNQAMLSSKREDYLMYVLYDMIVDEYINVSSVLHNQLEEIEMNILDSRYKTDKKMYRIHKNVVNVKNTVKRMKDNINPMEIITLEVVSSNLGKYFYDLDDHLANVLDKLESTIDAINTMFTLHSATLSNRMNSIMKTLTIFSVIFIPLSFLAGVFGMNFVEFDFLQNENGIIIFLAISLLIVSTMMLYFKIQKWF